MGLAPCKSATPHVRSVALKWIERLKNRVKVCAYRAGAAARSGGVVTAPGGAPTELLKQAFGLTSCGSKQQRNAFDGSRVEGLVESF